MVAEMLAMIKSRKLALVHMFFSAFTVDNGLKNQLLGIFRVNDDFHPRVPIHIFNIYFIFHDAIEYTTLCKTSSWLSRA